MAGTDTRIGRFTSEAARTRFFAAYDRAFELWPSPRREVDVETSFGPTRVHRYGPERGEPIVLLHGAATNSAMWHPIVAGLGENHPVHAVDTVGDPGRSVQRAPLGGGQDFARWLDEVLAELGLDRVHLVGASYGGWLALNQTLRAPERIATAILLDPGGFTRTPLRFYVHMFGSIPALFAPRSLRPWLARVLANVILTEPELMALTIEATRAYRRVLPDPPGVADDDLRTVRTSTRLLLAERTTLLEPSELLARARSTMPDVDGEIVPGTGHGLWLERPEFVTERILRFVAASPGCLG